MSFSYNVKKEIAQRFGNARHCNIAEIAAIINMCAYIGHFAQKICLKLQTENALLARKYFTLMKKTFKIVCNVTVRKNQIYNGAITYILTVTNTADVEKVLTATGILQHKQICNQCYMPVVYSICCRRAYIRGAFLAAGSINDPQKNYHLEFVYGDAKQAEQLQYLLHTFHLDAKMVQRKEYFVVYLKEGEQISDILNIMQAHISLLDMENVRVLKEVRNNINRKVNCETANLNKTVAAAITQIEDIQYIQYQKGLENLPRTLYMTAELRLQYPEASLKELGLLMTPPVGKSGVNHRLKKISYIAEELRKDRGDFAWQKRR
ncbi:DNA-binding protein WhiA [Lachnospiraceae bacterium 46-61]